MTEQKKQAVKKDTQSLNTSKLDREHPLIYIYDPETNKWKVHNPSGSIAYNCLTRDQWSWLD